VKRKRSNFYADTDPRAMQVWLDLMRKMTSAQKIAAVFELNELAIKISEAGVRRMYPKAGEREVFLRTVARRLDRDTMIRVYGWDPQAHE
jgi:hypothetical protein